MQTSSILRCTSEFILSPDNWHRPPAGAPYEFVALADYVHALEQDGAAHADPLLLWKRGLNADLASLGPLGEAISDAPTLGAALRYLEEGFPALQSGSRLRVYVEDDMVRVCYRVLDSQIWPRRGDSELTLGVISGICTRFIGAPAPVASLQFEHQACERTRPLGDWSRVDPLMEAEENVISFPARVLDAANPHQTRGNATESLAQLHRFIAMRREGEKITDRVSREILDRMGHQRIDQDAIAEALNMSRRTLRRRLAEEDTGFQPLLDHARRGQSQAWLKHSALPLSEIAFRLGYSDQTAFCRAFSRWFGVAPLKLRKSGVSGIT